MAAKQFTSDRKLEKARSLLTIIVGLLDENKIRYHLEGGTLLGFVRDREFLEWDHDIDLSIMSDDADKIPGVLKALRSYGYRTRVLNYSTKPEPASPVEMRVIRIKPLFYSLASKILPFLKGSLLTADIFIKYYHGGYAYWMAKGKLMRVPEKHYLGFDLVEYRGRLYSVPADHKAYLRAKYGNWNEPVKEWDCSVSERTIVG